MVEFIRNNIVVIVIALFIILGGVTVLAILLSKRRNNSKNEEPNSFAKAPVIYLDDDSPTEKSKLRNRKKADFAWVKDKSRT